MDVINKLFKHHNLRITPQRVAIYRAIRNDTSHPNAEMVYQKVIQECPNISFDTVNRTLICFSEKGILQTIGCSGQGRKYDPNSEPHHHVTCIKCGKIVDFSVDVLKFLEIPEEIKENFTVLTQRVVVTGICKQCNQ